MNYKLPPQLRKVLNPASPKDIDDEEESPEEEDDFQDRAEAVYRKAIAIFCEPRIANFINLGYKNLTQIMERHRIDHTDDKTLNNFFDVCVQICYTVVNRILEFNNGQVNVLAEHQYCVVLDTLCRMVCLMVKFSTKRTREQKMDLLKDVLDTVTTSVCNQMVVMRTVRKLYKDLTTNEETYQLIKQCFKESLC
ncbi:unnamed protein product [Bursaphelenchus okinawaensis]|uniref:Uncharacterized protein n=1 Tax=Bursaphelenchus okinawaensis TaxID=465554 RepID=A0A811KKX3_9BILA|nr:unnamed protein product [Bursaphelenchus okinawaensis]CAG9106756.1 unnamed protein product [Bursaphelenchus okinawaensis]